jgi:hypothetical protein
LSGAKEFESSGANQHRLRNPAGLGKCDVARNLPATRRMTDMHGLLQVERVGQQGHIEA